MSMIILRRKYQQPTIKLSSTKIGTMGMIHLKKNILGYNQKDIEYNNSLLDIETKIVKASMIPKQYFNK